MNNDDKHQSLRMLKKTKGLTGNQRIVLMLYAVHPTDRSGTVVETAAELANLVGLSPTVFSRTRKQLVAGDWLEETDSLGHIRYYRLSPKATGEEVVVELRRAT